MFLIKEKKKRLGRDLLRRIDYNKQKLKRRCGLYRKLYRKLY